MFSKFDVVFFVIACLIFYSLFTSIMRNLANLESLVKDEHKEEAKDFISDIRFNVFGFAFVLCISIFDSFS